MGFPDGAAQRLTLSMWGRLMTQTLRGTCKQSEQAWQLPQRGCAIGKQGDKSFSSTIGSGGKIAGREGPLPIGRQQERVRRLMRGPLSQPQPSMQCGR